MKSEKFFEIFTELDDDLIENAVPKTEEAETIMPGTRSFSWKTIVLSAAAVIAVCAAVFVGVKLIGSHRLNINEPPAITSENSGMTQTSKENYPIQQNIIEADWPVYFSAEQLIEGNDIIVSGKVTGISFAMLDKNTAKPVEDGVYGAELCTIYDVDVLNAYKGYSDEKLQIRMQGGLKGVEDDKQIEVLKEHGDNTISYLDNVPQIEVGEEYLFILGQFEDTLPCIIFPQQTAFPLKDRTSKEKYSNASVDDIIWQFCKISVVHKGETLPLTAEQSEALYFLMKEAWDKVQVANDAIIGEGQMREYSEIGYLITADHNLYVLIGEDENDTVIGNYSQTGLPEGYYERFMKILDGIAKQQTARNKVSAIYKGRTLTLTTEQVDALYSLMYEAESKVEIWMPATIAGMKEYGEKGYCITSNNGLVVLIGEDESDTLIGNGNLSGLPEGYYEKFMEILNGNTLQSEPQKKVTVVHEGETLLLTPEQSEALSEAVEQASFNDCGPLSELTRIISTQDMEEYGNNGYCITAEFYYPKVPLIKPGSDQRVDQIIEAVVLIGEEGKSSYITYSYIMYSADGASEKRSRGTFLLSEDSCENILKALNVETVDDTSSNTKPDTFFTTESVTFEQAKKQVDFAKVKEISDPDFIGYELGYVMPSGTVGKMTYLFKSGKVTAYNYSVIEVDFSTELNEKFERDGKVFWKTSEDAEDIRVFYKTDMGTVYLAETDSDVEEAIDVILSLI